MVRDRQGRVTDAVKLLTPREAWHLICEALQSGCPLEVVELRHPPGRKAYAFTVALEPGRPRLYVQLELGSGKIIGRSFHYSTTESEI